MQLIGYDGEPCRDDGQPFAVLVQVPAGDRYILPPLVLDAGVQNVDDAARPCLLGMEGLLIMAQAGTGPGIPVIRARREDVDRIQRRLADLRVRYGALSWPSAKTG